MNDSERQLIRHTLATLAYRCSKTIRGGDDEFANFRAGDGIRTPLEILAHIGDLLDWALTQANGEEKWSNANPTSWTEQADRFHAALKTLDERLASDQPIACTYEKLFQGPIADALTHVGQLATLRHLAGKKITGENYFVAKIETGRTGEDQPPGVYEF